MSGSDCIEQLLHSLKEEYQRLFQLYIEINKKKMIELTSEELITHKNTHICHICKHKIESGKNEKNGKVRDHCHLTGQYRGPANNNCNINYWRRSFILPIVFHNLKGYDSHLIIQKLTNEFQKVTCIPNNTEKYISFSLDRLRFIDSFSFMSCSLEKLVESTPKDKFILMRKHFNDIEEDKLQLLLQKGIYPYDYMDSFERLDETEFPSYSDFYSQLAKQDISMNDYQHGVNVYKQFNYRTLKDYHDLYLTTDVLLLADVFEQFRNISMESYSIDPAHYVSLPSFSWDAMLLFTQVEIQIFNDQQKDMYNFVEKSIRGGISMICNRYSKANNPGVEGYDKTKDQTHVLYLDANNLYGWAMSQYLPISDYEWVDPSHHDKLLNTIQSISDESEKGYIFQVDLEYPKELHDSHNDYPLASEKMQVTDEMLSDYSRSLKAKLGGSSSEVEKLILNLNNKTKYTVHYRNLKLYLQLGLKVSKVYKILQFKQKAWLSPYIKENTDRRSKAKSDFEKDFYKLMNNAVYGKTMENVRNRIDFELVTCNKDTNDDELEHTITRHSRRPRN